MSMGVPPHVEGFRMLSDKQDRIVHGIYLEGAAPFIAGFRKRRVICQGETGDLSVSSML